MRGSAGVTDFGSSQQLTSLNPGASQPVGRLGVSRVVPGPLPIGEVRGKRLLRGNVVGGRAKGVDVPAAPALGEQARAGPHVAMQRGEQRVVVGDPVEGGVREHDIDRLGEVELGEVLAERGGAGAEAPAGCKLTIDGATSTRVHAVPCGTRS